MPLGDFCKEGSSLRQFVNIKAIQLKISIDFTSMLRSAKKIDYTEVKVRS